MFLVAITKDEISHNFQNVQLEELKIHPFSIIFVTDNVLSKYSYNEDGFSVIESPYFSPSEIGNVVFSQGTYRQQDHSFIISRSTISGRPIYYTKNKKGDFFFSTHISLLRKAGIHIEEDKAVLPEFFIYRHITPPKTLYKNIKRLLIGEQLICRLKNNKCVIHSMNHYIPPRENQQITSITEGATKLYKYLFETINKLEPAKDETTLLLSGGIDSSTICTMYKKIFGHDLSYSTGYPFETPGLNHEKKYAITAGKALGMEHRYSEPTTPEYLAGLIEGIFHAEEPVNHFQSVLLHLLFKNEISREQRIILCAGGAGTAFGHNEFFSINEKRKKLLYRLLINNLSLKLLKKISKMTGRREELIDLVEKLYHNYPLNHNENIVWSWLAFGSWNWVCKYFNTTKDQIIKERYELIKEFADMTIYDILSRYSLYCEEDVTSAIWSKIGEGNKKIIYFPYYDADVLNYTFSIPWQLKLRENLSKELARQSKLPEFIINRPKMSFGLKSHQWSEKGGVFEPLVPIAAKVFNEREIRQMQTSSDLRKMQTFWNILNYSIWKRLHINNEPLDALLEELNEST